MGKHAAVRTPVSALFVNMSAMASAKKKFTRGDFSIPITGYEVLMHLLMPVLQSKLNDAIADLAL